MTRQKYFAALILLLVVSPFVSAEEKPAAKPKPKRVNPAFAAIEDDPKLPRVLLIGDSISIGYTLNVRKLLEGKANVHRPPTNCGPTTRGVEGLESWLGDKKWDVIHFNFGLHDLKYMGPGGQNLADPKLSTSKPQVSIESYQANLEKIVARLKKTGATLIWRNTTPVPEGAKGRVVGDAGKYNEVAAKVMKEHDIQIDDMYAYSKARLEKIQLPKNVHFSKEGSQFLAEKVAAKIAENLPK